MMYQESGSTLRTTTSFLVRFFLAVLALASLFTSIVRADLPTDQTSDAQLADDADSPIVTSNLNDGQTLTDTVPVVETIYEANPQEYTIRVANTDGTDVVVGGVPVGVTQNPASSGELRFDWDTTKVANGNYQVIMSARDTSDNTYTLTIQVVVSNQPTPPTYPPITSELTPIPQQAVIPPRTATPSKVTSPTNNSQPANVLGMKTKDQLAQRVQPTATIIPVFPDSTAQTCATFFGLCWYYSVPATVVMSAAAVGIYRLRNRE